ncbi:MAG: alpha/beta hydrolase, partial [Clostridia bacterium]|nr:alpha/beta hydrolase [Clostridia bacterium]
MYDKEIDPKSITMKLLIEDTVAVTEYLKDRFQKEQIYLMGFSGGSKIALEAAAAHPELYKAYIGMAQYVCDGAENDTYIYDFMKDIFTERNDKRRLKKLEQIVIKQEDNKVVCKDWYSFIYLLHDAGGGTTLNETEFVGIDIPIMQSHCYTAKEKVDYILGMKMYRKTAMSEEMKGVDYREK